MSMNYAYNFAEIDPTLGNMCIGVSSSTDPEEGNFPNMIPIPVNDPEYICKYYNTENGQWYEDAAFTIPWQSALLGE